MSTMLYNENPPLRNEAPVDLATTSPLPGRTHEQSVCSLGFNILPLRYSNSNLPKYQSDYQQLSLVKLVVSSVSRSPANPEHARHSVPQAYPRVLLGSGRRRVIASTDWRSRGESDLPRPACVLLSYSSPFATPYLILTTYTRLIHPHPPQTAHRTTCLPLSPPISPSPTAPPRRSSRMSTAPSLFPFRPSVT
jgi:hypothetical protein